MTKADAAVICEFHEGWLVDMDEGRGGKIFYKFFSGQPKIILRINGQSYSYDDADADDDNDIKNNDNDIAAGPQKNNLLKSLIGDADPGSPGFPGNQLVVDPILHHRTYHQNQLTC